MPIPSYTGLQTALSGLEAAQAAIDTTGQNIANANTPGYSRQTVNLTERNALTIPSLSSITSNGEQLGTGADITNITRIRDQFLDVQYRSQNTATSSLNSQATVLTQAQAALNEPSDSGLASSLQNLWSSFNALASNPTNLGAQQTAVNDGTAVAKTLNSLSSQVTSLETQVTQQYSSLTNAATGPIAGDAKQIASLNQEIAQAQAAGQTDNGLLDQRDQLVDDLSQYSNVNVSTQPNGMVNVSFGNAAIAAGNGTADSTPLVNGSQVNLSANLTDQNLSGSGGQLGALLGLYDSTTGAGQLQSYISGPGGLDAVAGALTSTVNAAIAGADSSGATATPFFTGSTAATIAVNPSVTISATNPPYTAAEAGAVNALSGGTADQTYNAFVAKVGSDVQSVQNGQQTAQNLLTAIGNQRQSVSGVSLDEEMTNLISEQQAYQAAARVMNTIDATLNTLINQVGASI